jgi:malate dehydrogenase (oxaloacetate-decarboxylating)
VSGAGAAGVAIIKMLTAMGAKDIIVSDRQGIIGPMHPALDDRRKMLLQITNPQGISGSLADGLRDREVFIGVSGPNLVTADMVKAMAKDPIIFALANPTPEIMPDVAKEGGARIVATGRSDFPNQVNNVLAYPGVFKGVLEARAPQITEAMKMAAAKALAAYVQNPTFECIIPDVLDKNIARVVADAVMAVH